MKHKKHKRSGVRPAARQPDEVFSSGPLRMMRFGRHVVSQTNWPPGEFDNFQARLVEGHDEVVRVLIAAKAPLDHVNNLHWTATIESIVLGDGGKRHIATLDALVKAGANLNLTDRNGNTPLTLAHGRSYKEMVAILESAGAK